MNLNFEWSPPSEKYTKAGVRWFRSAKIESDLQAGFWVFWKKNAIKLRDKGYGVYKNPNNNQWYINQWAKRKSEFDQATTKAVKRPAIVMESCLVTKPLSNTKGLKNWQPAIAERIVASIDKWGAALDGSDTGSGKCHTKGTKILMYDGSIKLVEDIEIGDLLMGDDSSPRRVLSLSQGIDNLFEIDPKTNLKWGGNSDHILILHNVRTKEVKEFTILDYITKAISSSRFKHEWKLIRTKVNYKETLVNIDPYFIGLWLGDGNWNTPAITCNKNDKEIISYLEEFSKNYNQRVYKSKDRKGSNCNTYYIRGNKKLNQYSSKNPNLLLSQMRQIGLCLSKNKFIPKNYKINSEFIRKQVLSGLIDSDGYKHANGNYEITTKWENLKNDIIQLATSLGYSVKVRGGIEKDYYIKKYKIKGTYWHIAIHGAHNLFCKLPRKQTLENTSNKSHLTSAFNINYLGKGTYYGFTLDGNHRYLLSDCTITHNTYVGTAVARELGMKIGVICPLSVIESWRRVIHNHFKMDHEFIRNYESLRTGKYDEIVTWGKVKTKSGYSRPQFIWKCPKDTLLIWDETHKCKGHDTKNSKMLRAAKKQGYKILCCSATSAINPLEMRALGYALGLHSDKDFNEWLEDNGCAKGRWGYEFNNDKYILQKLHKDMLLDRGVRITREEIPDFPECDSQAMAYNVGKDAEISLKNIYTDMKRELAALEKKSGNSETDSELVIMLRARQKSELVKCPLIIDLAEDSLADGMSVVIFLNFKDSIKAVAERLNTDCIIWGDNEKGERQANIDRFQADKSRVIIVSLQAGGAGLSLHDLNGKYPRMALISPSFSAIDLVQAMGRIWRVGAKTKAIQRIVYAANSVEEDVCNSIAQKLKNLSTINDGDLTPHVENMFKE